MIKQHHTYCAIFVSRCYFIAGVDNGVLESVNAILFIGMVVSVAKAWLRRVD